MKLNILGTEYEVSVCAFSEDEKFEQRGINGYCDGYGKKIVVCNMLTYPGYESEPPASTAVCQAHCLRHEIVHAFFAESGLMESAGKPDGAWPENEEMVDWFAVQGPKIYAAWQEAGALC